MKAKFLVGRSLARAFSPHFVVLWAIVLNAANLQAQTPSAESGTSTSAAAGGSKGVTSLEAILQKSEVPALGGAIVDSTGVKLIGVAGVRKKGETAVVTIDDVWRLGSNTKALTATMIAALVEQKKLSWGSTVGSVFPELGLSGQPGEITLLQLLSHRSGLPTNANWNALSKTGTVAEQRKAAVTKLKTVKLGSSPGSSYNYSNWGYVVAGAMASQVTGKTYEELMQSLLFEPLRMKSAGFSAGPTPGSLDAPWGHDFDSTPSEHQDLLVIAAAGSSLYCSLEDWGEFVSDQLRGAEGKPAFLQPESYARLHSAPFGGTYALGWVVAHPSWAGGDVLWHSGSNAYNYAMVSMAPARDIAVLTVCNAANETACRAAAAQLMALASLPYPIPDPATNSQTSAAGAGEIKLSDTQSDPILGDYTAPEGKGLMRISRESGKLFMAVLAHGLPQREYEFGATSETEFFMRVGGGRLSFVKDANGKVTRVILHQQNHPDAEFLRAQNSAQTTGRDEARQNDAPSSPPPTSATVAGEIKLDDAQSDPILGDYTLPGGMVMKISRDSGKLFMQVVGAGRPPQKNELGAASDTEFFTRRGGARLSFVKDSNGKVTRLILHQKNAPDQEFPRAQ